MKLYRKHISLLGLFIFQLLYNQLYAQKYDEIIYKINSVAPAKIDLDKGDYELSIKVWIEPNSFVEGIKTIINPIGKSITWNFGDVEIEKWVDLSQEFSISEKVENGTFIIQLIEDIIFGVGEGNFYIDDISLRLKENIEDKFTIQTVGETCVDKDNGRIEIKAASSRNYAILLNGIDKGSFTSETTLENIKPGDYKLCISATEGSFEQCFNIKIVEGNTISGKTTINANKASVEINEGTPPFNIKLNGKTVLQTSINNFEIAVIPGDFLEVTTNIKCEGLLTKKIALQEDILVYPNPVNEILNVRAFENSTIHLYNSLGALVKRIDRSSTLNSINISNLTTGVYYLKIISKDKNYNRPVLIK